MNKDTPVIILCGGKGTRIADVSGNTVPKPMVPIGGMPILWHIMKIYSNYGYKNFILALGHLGWEIKNYFLNYQYKSSDIQINFSNNSGAEDIKIMSDQKDIDWNIILAETGQETQTGMRIALCEKYVTTPYFMATYGDGVADIDLDALVKYALEKDKIGTVTSVTPTSRFGNIDINDAGVVREFNEKQDAGGGTINGGYFVFKKEFMEVAKKYGNVMLEREPIEDIVNKNQLAAYSHSGFWEPMDTMREYNQLNKLWDNNKAPWKKW